MKIIKGKLKSIFFTTFVGTVSLMKTINVTAGKVELKDKFEKLNPPLWV